MHRGMAECRVPILDHCDLDLVSNVQQNIEQLQNPTIGVTINNKSTLTEPSPQNGQQPKPPGGLNAFTGTKSSP